MVSKKQQKNTKRRRLVNFVGALAYLSVTLQWIMAVALFIPLISEVSLLKPEPAEITPVGPGVSASVNEPTLLTFIGIAVILLIMFAITAYVLAKMPISLARTGRKVVRGSSSVLATAVIKVARKKDTKRFRERLTPKIALVVKAAIVLLPVALAFSSRYLDEVMMSEYLALYIGVVLANGSFLLFCIQYGLAYAFGVKRDDIW